MLEVADCLDDDTRALSGYAVFAIPDATLTSMVDRIQLWTGRLTAFQAALVREIDGRGLVKAAGSANASTWLRDRARISIHDAHRVTGVGAVLDARPALAAAVLDGVITPEQALIIGQALDDIPADAGPDTVADAEAMLIDDATQENGVALCGFHHRLIHDSAWTIVMGHDRRPIFIPPPEIDPERQPRRNVYHQRT